jgi:hypothetical protein
MSTDGLNPNINQIFGIALVALKFLRIMKDQKKEKAGGKSFSGN